ncbi:MAG: hypothetical protein H0U95_04725 [Bacteroidetes bacterium]|nr:hypothetical protein [Bacteroidota bacterium]
MFKLNFFSFFLFVSIFLLSCKKDQKIEVQSPTPAKQPSVTFKFNAMVDNLPLVVNTKWYKNANGDSFTVTKFNYYISNLKFKRNDGTIFSEPNSYHIIKHVERVTSFTVLNLPEGSYDQIEFLIGVDSVRNISGSQTGDLSPDSLMFWDWSTGYIFFKLEGQYKNTTTPIADFYAMHIGGFAAPDNFIKKCTFNLTNKLIAEKNKQSKVFYNTSINEIFTNPNIIDFNTYHSVGGGRKSRDLSDNYQDMFTIDHIEN